MLCRTLPFRIHACGLSDIGLVRPRNEDVWGQLTALHFYVLADGMGGHVAGDIAAREAVDCALRTFTRVLGPEGQERDSVQEVMSVLRFVVKDANKHVFTMQKENAAITGMGTTLCCCCFYGDYVIYAHVGDSRIYRSRSGELVRLTQDHSLAQWLVDVDGWQEEDAVEAVGRHIVTKAIGIDPYVDPSLDVLKVTCGDRYLLCTDGLTDLVTDEEIEQLLAANPDNLKASQALINCAKERGGVDNITVVIITVEASSNGTHISR